MSYIQRQQNSAVDDSSSSGAENSNSSKEDGEDDEDGEDSNDSAGTGGLRQASKEDAIRCSKAQHLERRRQRYVVPGLLELTPASYKSKSQGWSLLRLPLETALIPNFVQKGEKSRDGAACRTAKEKGGQTEQISVHLGRWR